MDDTASIHVGATWKSPRDETRCIEATLRSFNGSAFVDFRALALPAPAG